MGGYNYISNPTYLVDLAARDYLNNSTIENLSLLKFFAQHHNTQHGER